MIRHLMKGLIRDRHRSLFPVMIVSAGVSISILMYCFMDGMIDDMVRSSARIDTGHLKIVTKDTTSSSHSCRTISRSGTRTR